MNKRSKIVELLSKIRAKTQYSVKDVKLFRVKYVRRFLTYEFNPIKAENYDQEIFTKNSSMNGN